MKEPYTLTEEDKQKILQAWNELKMESIQDIAEYVFGEGEDGRTFKGKTIKPFLASRGLKGRGAHEYKKVAPDLKLTPEQEQYIIMHAKGGALTCAREIFDDPGLSPLTVEARLVKAFWDSLDPSIKCENYDPNINKKYSPPHQIENAIARVNKYTNSSYEIGKINQRERDCFLKLIKYCKTWRFLAEINNLSLDVDSRGISEREFFEAQFVKWTFDKPDLTEEEIDIYISVGLQYIDLNRMRKRLDKLTNEMEIQLSNEDPKLRTSLVQAVSDLEKQIQSLDSEAKKSLQQLNGTRSQRLKDAGGKILSMSSLVEVWKQKEKRDKIINLNKKRKEALMEEMKNLATIDALRYEMWGLGDVEGVF